MELINKFKEHLLSKKNNASKATVKNYIADVRKFINWFETYYNKPFHPNHITNNIIKQYQHLPESENKTVSEKSLQRYMSSLRKFFHFLKTEKITDSNPFEQVTHTTLPSQKIDPLGIEEFKKHLIDERASDLTIKNYILDIKQFLNWASAVLEVQHPEEKQDKRLLKYINNLTLEEYKIRLKNEARMSPISINRKLSSIRKYFGWAEQKQYLKESIQVPPFQGKKESAKISNKETPTNHIEKPLKLEHLINLDKAERHDLNISLPTTYSSFAPIRLVQKTNKGISRLFDLLIIIPITQLVQTTGRKIWEMNGRELFQPIDKIAELKNPDLKPQVNQNENKETISTPHNESDKYLFTTSKEIKAPRIHNIPKSVYAPLKISTKGLSIPKKILHHLKHTRPEWYRKYRSYPISNYFQIAILVIFITAISFSIYRAFFENPKHQNALAALPTAPPRILSFQGRLTDASNNPLTAGRPLRFAIYNSATATGSALLWQEIDTVAPDQDGIFSTLLGNNTTIPSTLFAQNASLYLGITVGTDTELTPRQQLATVAYATNSETLQGLSPITQTGAGTSNVVLALDSAGNLTIGGSATPTFQASGGQFTLSGQALVLTTNAGSNTNVQISPDGLGTVDIQKPIKNTSNNNNIASAKTAVEIDDIAAILASSSGQSALTINQTGIGPLISASSSGTAAFTVTNAGAGTFASDLAVNGGNLTTTSTTFNLLNTGAINLNIGGAATAISIGANSGNTTINNTLLANNGITVASGKSLIVSGNVASNLIPSANNTYDLGSSTNYWNNLYVNNLIANSGATLNGFWQRNSGALAPANVTDDLLVGGTATSSAKFQVFGTTGNATISGNLTFTGTGSQIQSIKNQTLTLGGNTTGDIQFKPGNSSSSLYLASNGFVGIGTTTPSTNVDVENSANTGTYAFQAKQNNANGYGAYIFANSNSSTLDALNVQGWNGSSTINGLDVKSNGNVGIGTTSPGYKVEIGGVSTQFGMSVHLDPSTSGSSKRTGIELDNWQLAQDLSGNGTKDFFIYNDANALARFYMPNYANGGAAFGATSNLGNDALIVNQPNSAGDIFSASQSGNTKFVINNSGSVGIGTTTPTGLLNVNGGDLNVSGVGGQLTLRATGGAIDMISTNPLYVNNGVNENLYLLPNSPASVGIGTTSPLTSSGLDIEKNSLGNASLIVNNTGGSGDLFTASSSGSTKFQIDKSGNVNTYGGGNITANAPTGGGGAIQFVYDGAHETLGTTGGIDLIMGASSGNIELLGNNLYGSYASGNNFVIDSTESTTKGNILLNPNGATYGGSVAIGTSSPLAAVGLHVEKNSLGNALVDLNNTGTIGALITASSAGTTKFTVSNNGDLLLPDSGHIYFTNGSTTTPDGTNFALYSSPGGGETALNAPFTSSVLTFKLGNSENMRLNSTGFGIGTTGPNFKLDVQDNRSATAAAQIFNTNTTNSSTGLILKLGNTSSTAVASTNHFISFETSGIGIVGSIEGNGNKTINYKTSGVSDFAEYMKKDPNETIPWGSLLCLGSDGYVHACDNINKTITGIASQYPTFTGGEDLGNRSITVGLSGLVNTIVSTENGTIKPGDLITTSSLPGIGMRSTQTGTIVGKAVEGFDGSKNTVSCNSSSTNTCGKILVVVNVSWYNPNLQLTDSGDINIASNSAGTYQTVDKNGNLITTVETDAQAIIANISAGIIKTQKLTTDTLAVTTENITIGGQTLRNYITSIVEDVLNQRLKGSNNIALSSNLTPTPSITSPLSSKSAELTPTPSALAIDYASISGVLKSKDIQAEEATISGTLHVKNLIADNIAAATVSATYITNVYNSISTTSAQASDSASPSPTPTASPSTSPASTASANINQADSTPSTDIPINTDYSDISSMAGLLSYAPNLSQTAKTRPLNPEANLSDVSVAGQLSVGASMILTDNSINTLGADLQLQPLRQGNVQFEGGLIAIDTDGNLTVGGNAAFAKDVTVKGTLAANIIAPVPDKDLIIKLGPPSPISDQTIAKAPEFKVQNASGSSVFDLDQLGNVIASGSGHFAQLAANALNIVKGAQADTSLTETIATSSAGTAIITANETQRTIISPFVNKDSLIYLTATSDTQGVTPYVARQTIEDQSQNSKGSFTIEIPYPVSKDIHINWWIVN